MNTTEKGNLARLIARQIGDVTATKCVAYGDSFGKSGEILGILYPEGIPVVDLGRALSIVRIIDKLFRIASQPAAFGENPYRDIAGYAILGAIEWEEENHVDSGT